MKTVTVEMLRDIIEKLSEVLREAENKDKLWRNITPEVQLSRGGGFYLTHNGVEICALKPRMTVVGQRGYRVGCDSNGEIDAVYIEGVE